MVARPREGLTRTQKVTLVLTAASAVLVLVSGILVFSEIGAVDAAPGFIQFVLLSILVVGMARRQKVAFLGTLGVSGIFVLLGIGAFVIQPQAFRLPWFPAVLAVNIALGIAIIFVAWRSLREM